MRKSIALLIAALVAAALEAPAFAAEWKADPERRAKNVILMVPDGMGLADVTAARIFRNGPSGSPLSFETLDEIGYQRTYSANSTITDSAPAASAWACGEKFNNGEICFHGDGRPNPPSLLELARSAGMATGLVATSTITHATPAAFGAKVRNRNCEKEIARQYVRITKPDVILGGGTDIFRSSAPDACGVAGDFIAEAEGEGYVFVDTRAAMDDAAAGGAWRVLGLFSPAGMTPEYLRPSGTVEPRLPDMTRAALDLLSGKGDGFFLMVEGSQVDWANHANDAGYMLGEMGAFDEAVAAVRSWIDAEPDRKLHTLLVVLPDHETGGFAINGPAASLARPGEPLQAGWTTKDHTGSDVPIWSEGPGSVRLGRAIENTDVYQVVKDALQVR